VVTEANVGPDEEGRRGDEQDLIPDFLRLTAEERRANWEGRTLTDPYRGGNIDEQLARERALRAAADAERRAKRDVAREEMLARHAAAGEVYDRKMKLWVKNANGAAGSGAS
jgi:hypothetical protein